MSVQETSLPREIKIFLEQGFFSNSRVPSLTEIQQQFNIPRNEFLELIPLINQYVKENNLSDTQGSLLTPEQFRLAQQLLNPSDRRSLRTKLKECGVDMITYNRWRQQPAFQNYYRNQVRMRFKDADVTADLELVKLLEDGDLKAITYYNEMTGRHQTNDVVNLTRVLAMVMEVLVQFVTPDNLRKVAAALEERLEGVLDIPESGFRETSPPVGRTSTMPRLTVRSGND